MLILDLYLLFLDIMLLCFVSMPEELSFTEPSRIESCDLDGLMDIEDTLICRLEDGAFLASTSTAVRAFSSLFFGAFSAFVGLVLSW